MSYALTRDEAWLMAECAGYMQPRGRVEAVGMSSAAALRKAADEWETREKSIAEYNALVARALAALEHEDA